MNVRRATHDDFDTVKRFFDDGADEVWQRPFARLPFARNDFEALLAFIAEADDEAVGCAFGTTKPNHTAHVNYVYVRPDRRRHGVARGLLRAVVDAVRAEGVEHVTLDVDTTNEAGRAVWRRLGFGEYALRLVSRADELAQRLDGDAQSDSFASLHVQTDDERAVASAVRKYVPRLGRGEGTLIAPPRNGWTAVYDERCDRDGRALRRLASELSNATGAVVLTLAVESGNVVRYALVDRGQAVDEYASVPEFHGPLPPGDVVALSANPTVVARLTGADPADVRAVARTATSPADLPPAPALLAELARVLGVEGGEHGYVNAPEIPGAVRVTHG